MASELILGEPTEKQQAFLRAKARFTAYGGSRGGGKSWTVRFKAICLAFKQKGIQILIVRRTYAELYENHTIQLIKKLNGFATYKDSKKQFSFPNGSRIVLGYCDSERDVLRYQGRAYDAIFIDEATQLTEFQFQAFMEINRPSGEVKTNFTPRMFLTCNPGGVGHGWVKRLFIDREYRQSEEAEDYAFVQAKVYDNPYIMDADPNYVRMLENLPDNRRKAMLDGDWDVFEGRFFPEFKRETHVVEPFAIPNEWRKYRVFDYGLDCFACYFVAMSERNKAYFYREIHEKDLIVSKAAERLKEYSVGEEIYQTIAPPDMWNRHKDTGRSTADIFKESGIALTIADNALESGCLDLLEWLKVYQDEQGCEASDVQIFSNCKHLIKALAEIQTDDKRPNTYANEPHELTHAVDAMRYFFAKRPRAARKRAEEKHYNFDCEKPKANPIGKGLKIKVI